MRTFALNILTLLSLAVGLTACHSGPCPAGAEADPVSYYDSLRQCAVDANDRGDWAESDSLTDCIRAYVTRQPDACCDDRLPRLAYFNEVTAGISAIYSGRLPLAIERFEAARDLTVRYALTDRYYDMAINLSDVYIQAGRLPEAAEILRHGLYLCDSLTLKPAAKVPFFNALSTIYLRLGDYATSLRYSDDALPCLPDAAPLDRFSFWNSRGNVYYMREDFDAALHCFDSALVLCRRSEEVSDYNAYITLLNRTDVRVRLGRYDSVELSLDSCEAYFEANQLTACSYYAATLRARLLLERDDDAPAALALLRRAPQEVDSDYLRYLRRSLQRECYLEIGLSDSVVGLDRALLAYKDSLLTDVAAMRVSDVELRYKENLRASQLMARQRTLELRIFIVVLLALICVLLCFVLLSHYRHQRRLRDYQYEQLSHNILKEKVRGLRMRLSPHYLMNLASLLDRQAQGKGGAEVDGDAIAMTLRRSLELSSQVAATLADEVAFVKDYLRCLPSAAQVHVRWQIAADVQPALVHIPGMSIQLPVENAVKHAYPVGCDVPPEARTVDVVVTRSERRHHPGTQLLVEDYGVGLRSDAGCTFANGYDILTQTIRYLNTHNRIPLELQLLDKATRGLGRGLRVTLFVPDGYRF
jgi:tetratricopeptide (TPR) repeat protein